MNRIEALEAEADRRRADFAVSLRKLRLKLTPLGLVDEALRRLDPHGEAVVTAGKSLRRNPLPIVPVLLGLSWLVLNARTPSRPAQSKRKSKSLIASQRKENPDENHEKAQAGQSRP
jgi:hypothetical protein